MHEEAHEARHGDAAVLELRLAQEADGRLVGLLEEHVLAEAQRVEVADDRVLLRGQGLQLGEAEAAGRGHGRL